MGRSTVDLRDDIADLQSGSIGRAILGHAGDVDDAALHEDEDSAGTFEFVRTRWRPKIRFWKPDCVVWQRRVENEAAP